jgi:hypothetical protein
MTPVGCSRNLCFKPKRNRANANLAGQNGKRITLRPALRAASCTGKARKHRGQRAKR